MSKGTKSKDQKVCPEAQPDDTPAAKNSTTITTDDDEIDELTTDVQNLILTVNTPSTRNIFISPVSEQLPSFKQSVSDNNDDQPTTYDEQDTSYVSPQRLDYVEDDEDKPQTNNEATGKSTVHKTKSNETKALEIVTLVTWNTCRNTSTNPSTTGYAPMLEELRDKIHQSLSSSSPIYLIQKGPSKEDITTRNMTGYDSSPNKEERIVLPSSRVPPRHNFTIKDRYTAGSVRIEGKSVRYKVMVVSYRGRSNRGPNAANIQNEMIAFFQEMRDIANRKKINIIVGGDFKLPLEKREGADEKKRKPDWKDVVESKIPEVTVAEEYPLGPRRKAVKTDTNTLKDTFAIVRPSDGIEYNTRCSFAGPPRALNVDDLTDSELIKAMDHDPVLVKVKLETIIQVRPTTDQPIEQVTPTNDSKVTPTIGECNEDIPTIG